MNRILLFMRIPTASALLLAVMPACAPTSDPSASQVSREADVSAIRAFRQAIERGRNLNDAAAVIAEFDDGAVVMLPGRPAVTGKEAIARGIEADLASNAYQMTISEDELEVFGDWALSRGAFITTVTPKAGDDPTQVQGKYVSIYQRQADGSWKLARHIRNNDDAPTGAED